MNVFLKPLIKNIFRPVGYEIKSLSEPIRIWEQDKIFNALYEKVRDRTLLDKTKCYIIYQFARGVLEMNGEAAEVGVYKGGSAKLLADIFSLKGKTIHLYDTFCGMPPTDPRHDLYDKGSFGDTSFDSVTAFLKSCYNVMLHPGYFPDTAQSIIESKFCFVHIDVDIYRSVMDCCDFFHPRLLNGGVMIFDDYGSTSCPGARLAVDDYFKDKPEFPSYLPTGQCLVIKR